MFGILERKVEEIKNSKLIRKIVYDVVKSKGGYMMGGMGYRMVATFTDKNEAKRYKEEQEYLEEQKRAEYERNKKEREPQNGSSREWDRHVAECYNDWNVAHGYRY